MDRSYSKWLDNMNWHVDFYNRGLRKKRVDDEYDWVWVDSFKDWKECIKSYVRPLYNFIRKRSAQYSPYSQQWLNENGELLWGSRQMLEDDISRLLFDCTLLVCISGYEKYYYPRIDFVDFITIIGEEDFYHELPKSYLGIPLKIFKIQLKCIESCSNINILTTRKTLEVLNSYRQYFIKRGHVDLSPSTGDIVFDCGSCIGDTSLLFAALVGHGGKVHTFDPVPLHNRYCTYQAELNPSMRDVLQINTLGICDTSIKYSGSIQDANDISPGGCAVDNFEATTLDDYFVNNSLNKVDYIKMDIEGSEMSALHGSSNVILEHKPKLAISTYHKPQDLWNIPEAIKKLNPDYKLYFGHHSPMIGESVYYAI